MRSRVLAVGLVLGVMVVLTGGARAALARQDAPRFGGGTLIVGTDVQAGTYRTRGAGDGCYWERLSGFDGSLDDIIANQFASGPQVVTIAASDAGFHSDGCGNWTDDLSPITSDPTAAFGQGEFIVGVDLAAGVWRASGGSACYWERLSGFGGMLNQVIANDFTSGGAIVTIGANDAGFRSDGCGTWTKVR